MRSIIVFLLSSNALQYILRGVQLYLKSIRERGIVSAQGLGWVCLLMKLCAKCGKITNATDPYCNSCRPLAAQIRSETLERNRKKSRRDYRSKQKFQDFYNGKAWKNLSTARMIHDKHMCCYCSTPDNPVFATGVHHVIPLWKDYSKRYDFDNLRSACDACHHRLDAELRAQAKGQGVKKV